MAKLTRKTAKVFGATASTSGTNPDIGQFGSAKAGTYVGTGDIDSIQALTAWSNGWIDAVTPTQQFPTLPEMTGVHKVLSYQEAYLLQEGVPEYDANTTYYTDSLCKGKNAANELTLFRSKADDNTGNALTNTTYWEEFNPAANRELSNLSTTGNNRLHALKSYEDAGETLTDAEGYSDVLKYAHSTFDLSKFTVTGSPTITNDGIASDFSSSNYVGTIQCKDLNGKSWVQRIRFYWEPLSDLATLINLSGGWWSQGTVSLDKTNKNLRFLAKFGDTEESSSEGEKLQLTNVFATTGWYIAEIKFDITTGVYTLSVYNDNGVLIDSGTHTPTVTNKQIYAIATNSTAYIRLGFGATTNGSTSIDLKSFSIIANSVPVFNGNKTGTDTYTIGGSTVTIPFTWSKTGSKIVDASQSTNLADLYAQEGIAPYYMLDEINGQFALPQGEIYGMIGRNASGDNAMPSVSKALTLGPTGTTYTAPSAGYFQFTKTSGAANTFISLTSGCLSASNVAVTANDNLAVFLLVKKGETVTANYTATGSTITFAFVYTKGTETVA